MILESLPDIGPCVYWPGYVDNSGYATFSATAKFGIDTSWNGKHVSRYLYGLYHPNAVFEDVDHLCGDPLCFALYHLDGVSHAENLRRAHVGRQAVCRKCGGELSVSGDGSRRCASCRQRQRKTHYDVTYDAAYHRNTRPNIEWLGAQFN